MEWISEHSKLVEFYRYVSAQEAEKFSNPLLITILQQQTFSSTLYIVFGIFVVFMISSMTYLSYYLFEETPTGYFDGVGATVFRLLIGSTSLVLMYLEYGSFFNGQNRGLGI